MIDPYLYESSSVLRNLLDIKDAKTLDLVEAEQSRANMMLLFEAGFSDFSAEGLQYIHKYLFGDIYEWAGEFRVINIQKREEVLAGASVWYSNVDAIKHDLGTAWHDIHKINWAQLSREQFVSSIVRTFPILWKVHPFREGNTRTIVMLMTFFIEHYGYYVDQDLLAASAGYMRNALVLASLENYAENEHLEKILLDAVKTEHVDYEDLLAEAPGKADNRYSQYRSKEYKPTEHEIRSSQYDSERYRK